MPKSSLKALSIGSTPSPSFKKIMTSFLWCAKSPSLMRMTPDTPFVDREGRRRPKRGSAKPSKRNSASAWMPYPYGASRSPSTRSIWTTAFVADIGSVTSTSWFSIGCGRRFRRRTISVSPQSDDKVTCRE